MTATNRELAAAAVGTANANGRGTKRRAAGCAAVALRSTTSVKGAKKALAQARLDEAVRDAAVILVDALAANHNQATTEAAATQEGTA